MTHDFQESISSSTKLIGCNASFSMIDFTDSFDKL